MPELIARLRTWAFLALFFGGSVPIVLLSPIAAMRGTMPLRRWVVFWTRFHRWCARVTLGIRPRIIGTIPSGPTLYAAKHQAMFETFELVAMLDAPAIVMKQELGDIPIWGWAAKRYGMIVIDREGSSAALRSLLRAAQQTKAEGRSVVIFPEGTRVKPGEAPPMKAGFAGLYRALGMAVVPVAIDSGRAWPKHGAKRPNTPITFRFGAVIPPGLPRKAVDPLVHAEINALEPAAALSDPIARNRAARRPGPAR